MNYIDLVLDNGELVRIECPDKHYDECMDYFEHSMKTKDWFCPSRFDGCKAEYLGMSMNRVAMSRVVGML